MYKGRAIIVCFMAVTVCAWDDPVSWNEFVAGTPHAHFQQSWEWGDLAPDLGGTPLRLAALREGQPVGAMQVFINPVAHIGRSYLYVPRGPALAHPSLDVLGPLLDAARLAGEDYDALGIRVEPNAPHCSTDWKRALGAMHLRPAWPPSQPRSSWMLDLRPDLDKLLGDMKSKTRYNIRLAAKKGVTVRDGVEGDLGTFYQLFRDTATRDDFFIHHQELYARMYAVFRRAGNFRMLLAEYQGTPIACVTLIRFGHTCWYLQGASSNEHRNVMAPYLLQWEAIQWARAQGCTLYDFRAVPDVLREDQDMYGVYRFKEGFGGYQYTTLHTYATPYRPFLYGLWQLYFGARFALDAARRRHQGLPARQFA